VKLPPGAEGLATLISARDLKATEIWQPESGSAKAGDAFTRTITFSAPDIPAMVFPPFTTTEVAGLGVYPGAPRLLDHSERGTMRGERQDIVTYVCQRSGRFVVPAARLPGGILITINFKRSISPPAPSTLKRIPLCLASR
jgi:hypothetical protein